MKLFLLLACLLAGQVFAEPEPSKTFVEELDPAPAKLIVVRVDNQTKEVETFQLKKNIVLAVKSEHDAEELEAGKERPLIEVDPELVTSPELFVDENQINNIAVTDMDNVEELDMERSVGNYYYYYYNYGYNTGWNPYGYFYYNNYRYNYRYTYGYTWNYRANYYYRYSRYGYYYYY